MINQEYFMEENNNIKEIYRFLEDTLKLMVIPSHININERNDLIESNLEELEGDFYTFMNPINLNKLHSENLIDDNVKFKLEQLFILLQDIESENWGMVSFLTNPKWLVIRSLAKEVTQSIGHV